MVFLQQSENKVCGIPVRPDPKARGLAFARGIWPFKWIAVAPAMSFLSPSEQQAVLLHEAGHCYHFHMEKRFLALAFCWLPTVQRWAREQEHQADAFAVREGHGMELLRILRRFPQGDSFWHPSPAQREQRILRLMRQERHHVRIAA